MHQMLLRLAIYGIARCIGVSGGFGKASHIQHYNFALDKLEVPTRPLTPASKTVDVLGPLDETLRVQDHRFRPKWVGIV